MSQVKAKLSVVLMADSVTVAEVEDPRLWQQVLNVINGDAAIVGAKQPPLDSNTFRNGGPSPNEPPASFPAGAQGDSKLAKFADFLKLDSAIVDGACSPTDTEPYLHLNPHCWEAFKNQVTNFSGKSISPIGMAATLLLCWSHSGGPKTVTQAAIRKVLGTINLTDKNPSRGLKTTSWISMRAGGTVLLNPAEVSKGQLASRCFCRKDWTDWKAS